MLKTSFFDSATGIVSPTVKSTIEILYEFEQYIKEHAVKGDTGAGVVSIQKTGSTETTQTFLITFTDETTQSVTIDVVKGDKGDKGEVGAGVKTIEKISSTETTQTFKITFTDDTTQEVEIAVVKGDKGEQGEQGTPGLNSVKTISFSSENGDLGALYPPNDSIQKTSFQYMFQVTYKDVYFGVTTAIRNTNYDYGKIGNIVILISQTDGETIPVFVMLNETGKYSILNFKTQEEITNECVFSVAINYVE